MLYLGVLYYCGNGVNQDVKKAINLFEKVSAIPIKIEEKQMNNIIASAMHYLGLSY